MASTINRRQVLVLITSGSLGGCLGRIQKENHSSTADAQPNAGALVLKNLTDHSNRVTITVRKISSSDDGVPSNEPPPEQPASEDIWNRTQSYAIDANEQRVISEFITETGTYFIEASSPENEGGNEWLALSKAYGGGVTGRYLTIEITYQELRVFASEPE